MQIFVGSVYISPHLLPFCFCNVKRRKTVSCETTPFLKEKLATSNQQMEIELRFRSTNIKTSSHARVGFKLAMVYQCLDITLLFEFGYELSKLG